MSVLWADSALNWIFCINIWCGDLPQDTIFFFRSWVKRGQLDATCFIITLFSAQHVSDVNTSILRSLRLIRKVTSWIVSGSMCVGVPLQCGYGGVVFVCSLKHYSLLNYQDDARSNKHKILVSYFTKIKVFTRRRIWRALNHIRLTYESKVFAAALKCTAGRNRPASLTFVSPDV